MRQLGLSDLPKVTQLVSVKCLRWDLNSGPPDSCTGALSTVPPSCLAAYCICGGEREESRMTQLRLSDLPKVTQLVSVKCLR